MYQEQEDVYYYITLMNENYPHPAMPAGAEEGIIKGLYLLQEARGKGKGPRVQLMGAARSCAKSSPPPICCATTGRSNADIWSATSFNELRRDGMSAERWNLLHPDEAAPQELRRDRRSRDTPGR